MTEEYNQARESLIKADDIEVRKKFSEFHMLKRKEELFASKALDDPESLTNEERLKALQILSRMRREEVDLDEMCYDRWYDQSLMKRELFGKTISDVIFKRDSLGRLKRILKFLDGSTLELCSFCGRVEKEIRGHFVIKI